MFTHLHASPTRQRGFLALARRAGVRRAIREVPVSTAPPDRLLDPETRALLALHLVPGLGPRLTKALLERFGSAAGVLRAAPHELAAVPHLNEKTAQGIRAAAEAADVAKELALLERYQTRLIRLGTPEYPEPLAAIIDPPALLYIRGTLMPADRNAIAIVGSRHCTPYGRRIAQRLAADLVRAGYTVVSGLARGVDSEAHRGALAAGGRTIAVLAGGLSRIYPPEHAELADAVAAAGALLSEAAMAMAPMAGMFPARNRLISGLSRGVVIVEAAEKSGALITARHAADQGRPVFAVPGPLDSPASSGTHALIRDGAILIRSADDILEELDGVSAVARSVASRPSSAPRPATTPPPGLDDVQMRLWAALADHPRHFDELVQQLGLGVSPLTTALLTLEMKRLVRRLPGNRYERC
jgi:DNA processing protein